MYRFLLGFLFLLSYIAGPARLCAGEGLLGAVRHEVREEKSNSHSDDDEDRHHDDDDSDGNLGTSILLGLLGALFEGDHDHHSSSCHDDDSATVDLASLTLILAASPFWVPPVILMGDTYDGWANFQPYPYAHGYPGYIVFDVFVPDEIVHFSKADSESDENSVILLADEEIMAVRPWAWRTSVEYGHDFDDLERIGGQLIVSTARRLGLETSWDHFREDLANGTTDDLTIGDLNLTFRFAQNEKARMYTGLGMRLLSDDTGTDYGFNFTYGADFFPKKPIVLSGSIDLGTLRHSTVFHGRVSVGAVLWHGEIFVGYDFWDFESVELRTALAGIRLWF